MRPWLRLLERIQGLPIEQLDQHMARTLADELGVPYQPVRGWGGGVGGGRMGRQVWSEGPWGCPTFW